MEDFNFLNQVLDGIQFDLDEERGSISVYENPELTAIYGDDDAITSSMIEIVEALSGKKVVNPGEVHLDYNDPGDSGDNATFHLSGFKLEVC